MESIKRSVLFLLKKTTSNLVHRTMSSFSSDSKTKNSIVWIDCEMTGLNVETDKLLEISCIITDKDLNITAEGPDIVLHETDEVLKSMDDWCLKQHEKTGLIAGSRNSKITVPEAEAMLLDFVKQHICEKSCPVAGNSVYVDRLFLNKYMPLFNQYMHYRIIDVSSIKELCLRWNPVIYSKVPEKKFGHRSLADIKESIEELKFYKQFFFVNSS